MYTCSVAERIDFGVCGQYDILTWKYFVHQGKINLVVCDNDIIIYGRVVLHIIVIDYKHKNCYTLILLTEVLCMKCLGTNWKKSRHPASLVKGCADPLPPPPSPYPREYKPWFSESCPHIAGRCPHSNKNPPGEDFICCVAFPVAGICHNETTSTLSRIRSELQSFVWPRFMIEASKCLWWITSSMNNRTFRWRPPTKRGVSWHVDIPVTTWVGCSSASFNLHVPFSFRTFHVNYL